MQRIHADNDRNESQIDFVIVGRREFATPDEFYAAAIRLLWEGWDSDEHIEQYIANANRLSRSVDELQNEVAECLGITPVERFMPDLDDIDIVVSFRDDWNVKEFVWCSDRNYWLMAWGTSA